MRTISIYSRPYINIESDGIMTVSFMPARFTARTAIHHIFSLMVLAA